MTRLTKKFTIFLIKEVIENGKCFMEIASTTDFYGKRLFCQDTFDTKEAAEKEIEKLLKNAKSSFNFVILEVYSIEYFSEPIQHISV